MGNISYGPEGSIIGTTENREYISSISGLEKAMLQGKILEANAVKCDGDMNLFVDLYGITGIIEKREALYLRENEEIKDIAIITRVGKPVCFKVLGIEMRGGEPLAILSRRAAQLDCLQNYLSCLNNSSAYIACSS